MDGGNNPAPWPNKLRSRAAVRARRNLVLRLYEFMNDVSNIGVMLRIDRLRTAIERVVSTAVIDDQTLVGTFVTA
jgi:hypothetical protein